MQDGGVIEKTLPRLQWLPRCMSSIQFVIAGLSATFHWADNFLSGLDKGNAS